MTSASAMEDHAPAAVAPWSGEVGLGLGAWAGLGPLLSGTGAPTLSIGGGAQVRALRLGVELGVLPARADARVGWAAGMLRVDVLAGYHDRLGPAVGLGASFQAPISTSGFRWGLRVRVHSGLDWDRPYGASVLCDLVVTSPVSR